MAKPKTLYTCQSCGHSESKWVGKCTVCGEWNTFVEETLTPNESLLISAIPKGDSVAKNLSEITADEPRRISTKLKELDRVLGGGIVEDEVLLLSGEPGVGKSTLLMQLAHELSSVKRILYVSAEESARQVAIRSRRLASSADKKNLLFLGTGALSQIEKNIKTNNPEIVIIDSIQTIFDESLSTLPGGVSQVRSCAAKLTYLAKTQGFIILFIGHINKDGKIAGPKVLEHMVDCVLQLEGHSQHEYRILRALKNRFGSAGEVGLFTMQSTGLEDINYADQFLSMSSEKMETGTARALIVEGSRPLILDIQSLSSTSVFPFPKRVSEGISISRLQVLAAIVENAGIVKLASKDLYVRTSGAYSVKDYTCSDLAVIASIYSAAKKKPINQSLVFVGEVTLNGQVYCPQYMLRYVREITKISRSDIIVTSSEFLKKNSLTGKSFNGIKSIDELGFL